MIIKAFRWYGGKLRMVDIIRKLIPEHTEYYEPFMGSAAVLLNHLRSKVEVINDLDSDLVCFMKTLADRDKGKLLVEELLKLEYGRHKFDEAKACMKTNYSGLNEVERAVKVFTLITQSFNATRKDFSAKAYKNNYDYRKDVRFYIPKVYKRLGNVIVKNMNGIDLLEEIADNPTAFAFVDPPYRHELRGEGADKAYACELPQSEQIRLLETLHEAKCKIMLCGYRSAGGIDLYDQYLLPYGWKCYKLADVVKACQASKEHRDIAEEFIWVNYELPPIAKYVISMKEYSSL